MDADVIVVGGGYWGTCFATLAREAGHEVLLLDDDNPSGASRNSAGIFQAWWYKAETSANKIPANWEWRGPSMRWLQERDLVSVPGEWFASNRKPEPRLRDDCMLVDPAAVHALAPRTHGRVEHVRMNGTSVVVSTRSKELRAPKVFVAAGAWTDELLRRSALQPHGVVPLRGRALVVEQDEWQDGVMTVLPAPYRHYTLRPWGAHWRFGDTVEKGATDIVQRALIPALTKLVGDFKVREVLDGVRPVTKQYVCTAVGPGLVVATGGHRVGLGLSEPVARRAMRLLGMPCA